MRSMLSGLVQQGVRRFIRNATAEVQVLIVPEGALPIVIVDQEANAANSYVCSPSTHYIDYAREEVGIELANQPLLARIVPPILSALRPIFRFSQIERSVYVNNWMLSTNLYPKLSRPSLVAIRRTLLQQFPDHTIVFRSLNEGMNAPIIDELEALGFQKAFSRQVYLLDPRNGSFRRRNSYGNDRRLTAKSTYRWRRHASLGPNESGRLVDLYNQLYLDKYSHYNPQFTRDFVEQALEGTWLRIAALERDSRIDGLLGVVEQHGIITAPLVGYERSVSQKEGLYRLLMFDMLQQAIERNCLLHLSSGAAEFKRLRGAEAFLEYSLVYTRHLKPQRRMAWNMLSWLSKRAIIPVMQHYQL
jgi:hypothetical protein